LKLNRDVVGRDAPREDYCVGEAHLLPKKDQRNTPIFFFNYAESPYDVLPNIAMKDFFDGMCHADGRFCKTISGFKEAVQEAINMLYSSEAVEDQKTKAQDKDFKERIVANGWVIPDGEQQEENVAAFTNDGDDGK